MKKRIPLLIIVIPAAFCFLFCSCSSRTSPEKCIKKYISMVKSEKYSKAAELTKPDPLFIAGDAVYAAIAELTGKKVEIVRNNYGTYSAGEVEFVTSEDNGKFSIVNVVHPKLTVLMFLDRFRNREFSKAAGYLPPEIQEEFVLMLSIITDRKSGKNEFLFDSWSVGETFIEDDTAKVSALIESTETEYSLRYEDSRWLLLYPVKNLWVE